MTNTGERGEDGLAVVTLSRKEWWRIAGFTATMITAILGGWWNVSAKLVALETTVWHQQTAIEKIESRVESMHMRGDGE